MPGTLEFTRNPLRSHSNKPSPFEIASVALAVPQTAVAFLQLADTKIAAHIAAWGFAPAAKWSAIVGGLGCSAALARRMVASGLVWRPLWFLSRIRLESFEQPTPVYHAHYSALITEQPRLLLMTDRELARRVGLHIWDVAYLKSHPDDVPHLDVEKRIRNALMVPHDWPRNGYGEEYTLARLIWYGRKHVHAIPAAQISAMPKRVRAAKLRLIEAELRDHLGLGKKANNGD